MTSELHHPTRLHRGARMLGWLLLIVAGSLVAVHFGLVIHQRRSRVNPGWGEDAAVGALRTLSSVQQQFRDGDREGDGKTDYATSLMELSRAGLIDEVLITGDYRSDYRFEMQGNGKDWWCRAVPIEERERWGLLWKTHRNFIICTDGIVRVAPSGERATCASPPLLPR